MSLAHQIVPADGNDGLALDDIQVDGGTQSRATLNDQVVSDYAEAISAGATFPPIVVFYDGKKHWLADGFHRFHAYQKAGRTHARADVRQGTRRDAVLHSVGANATHGLRRTSDDKRRAVLTLIEDPEWSKWSDREIARRCMVSDKTVAKLRPVASAENPQIERTVQRGGTVYTQKVAKAAAQNAPEALVNDEPSPEAGPQAEASLAGTGTGTPADREGRIDGEAASVDLPTISDFDQIVALWGALTVEDREAFVTYLRESGAINFQSDGGAVSEVKGKARPENAAGVEPSPSDINSPSAAPAAEAVAALNPQAPHEPATATNFPDPHTSKGATTAVPATSTEASGAKNDALRGIVGRGGIEPRNIDGHSVQEPASAAQARNEPGRASEASVTQFTNPQCQRPATCKLAHSQATCSECANAWMKARVAHV